MAEELKNNIFGKGEVNPFGQFFVGQSYLNSLTGEGVGIANVTFEPGCRNNWHVHKGDGKIGQILLCTDGEGWYQEWKQPAQYLHAGDVVSIPVGVKHWHGAAQDKWFSHVAISVPNENGGTEWLEMIDPEEYDKL